MKGDRHHDKGSDTREYIAGEDPQIEFVFHDTPRLDQHGLIRNVRKNTEAI